MGKVIYVPTHIWEFNRKKKMEPELVALLILLAGIGAVVLSSYFSGGNNGKS